MIPDLNNVQLTKVELATLVSLVRIIADLDDDTTPEESDEFGLIARQVGEEAFWAAFEARKDDAASLAQLAEYAKQVERRPAQELIFTLLDELADADGIDDEQRTVLEKLRHHWVLED